jgi:hypothetical protein
MEEAENPEWKDAAGSPLSAALIMVVPGKIVNKTKKAIVVKYMTSFGICHFVARAIRFKMSSYQPPELEDLLYNL